MKRNQPKEDTISKLAGCVVSLKSTPKVAGSEQFGGNFGMQAKSCILIPTAKF